LLFYNYPAKIQKLLQKADDFNIFNADRKILSNNMVEEEVFLLTLQYVMKA